MQMGPKFLYCLNPQLHSEPVVILINQGTRGPAELVALTLQENGMATLVGERSAGEAIDYHVLYPNKQLVLLMADVRLLSSKRQWHDAGVVPNLSISIESKLLREDRQHQAGGYSIGFRQTLKNQVIRY